MCDTYMLKISFMIIKIYKIEYVEHILQNICLMRYELAKLCILKRNLIFT